MIPKSLEKLKFERELPPRQKSNQGQSSFNEAVLYKALSKTLMGTVFLQLLALLFLGIRFSNYAATEKIIIKDSSQTSGVYQKGQLKRSIMEREVKKYINLWGNVDFDSVDSSFSELYRNMELDLRGRIKVQFSKFANHLKEKKIIFSSSISDFKLIQNKDQSFHAEGRLYKKVFKNDEKAKPVHEIVEMELVLNRDSEVESLIPIRKFKVYSEDQYKMECVKCLLK